MQEPDQPSNPSEPSPTDEIASARRKLREELGRLRFKLEHSTDKDIRAVLQMRIEQILSELPVDQRSAPVEEPIGVVEPAEETSAEGEEAAEVVPLTLEQSQEVDRLVRQARVEKMRGNAVEATNLLQRAADLAPSSGAVLEALGDNLMERRQLKPAIGAYKRALKLAPRNVGLEEKLAMAALQVDAAGSIENQLRLGMGDSLLGTQQDVYGRWPVAVILSAICPGVGHFAMGKTGAGIAILVTWCIAWIFLLIKHTEVENLAKMVAGKSTHVDMGVVATLFVMAIIWIGSLASLKPKETQQLRAGIQRPVPPANLPFE